MVSYFRESLQRYKPAPHLSVPHAWSAFRRIADDYEGPNHAPKARQGVPGSKRRRLHPVLQGRPPRVDRGGTPYAEAQTLDPRPPSQVDRAGPLRSPLGASAHLPGILTRCPGERSLRSFITGPCSLPTRPGPDRTGSTRVHVLPLRHPPSEALLGRRDIRLTSARHAGAERRESGWRGFGRRRVRRRRCRGGRR